jgi:pseudouridine-5'-phosphate glycosidase
MVLGVAVLMTEAQVDVGATALAACRAGAACVGAEGKGGRKRGAEAQVDVGAPALADCGSAGGGRKG